VASEHSEQMMLLLQELASLKEADHHDASAASTPRAAQEHRQRQRRLKEISKLMDELAATKKSGALSPDLDLGSDSGPRES
jgi:hypothetical protein